MIEGVRTSEQALGAIQFGMGEQEEASRVFRRSLFVVKDMEAGEEFSEENVRSIRPGYGLHTRHLEEILGRKAGRSIVRGTPLAWGLVTGTGQ